MNNRIKRNTAEVMRDEMVMRHKILAFLDDNPGTIPEIAQALECSTNSVMYWIMAMWRYGSVEAVGKADDEGYYRYRPVSQG
jgi:predicted transcriptional regulator